MTRNLDGEVAEWSIATVLKTVGGASPPGVRIPPSPPFSDKPCRDVDGQAQHRHVEEKRQN